MIGPAVLLPCQKAGTAEAKELPTATDVRRKSLEVPSLPRPGQWGQASKYLIEANNVLNNHYHLL